MQAAVGDRLHFRGKAVGMSEHSALIIETRGEGGTPPFLIRYDDGHETVVFPGVDSWVEHVGETDTSEG